MKKRMKVAIFTLVIFTLNLVLPTIQVSAVENSNTEINQIVEDETNLDAGNESVELFSNGDMIFALENPVNNHNLTGDLFVKGWAIDKNGIDSVEVFIDGKSLGNATYGVERKDVQSKYPAYPNSLYSGFTKEIKGISNGSHSLKVVITSKAGEKKETAAQINVNNNKTVIMGSGQASDLQMISMLKRRNPGLSLSYIREFVYHTIEEAKIEGVNSDILFAQMMHETGYLNFGGDVKPEQNNFAGLGAVGNGAPGESFPTVQIGVRAVVQHLKAYASTESLKLECVDTRFKYVERGSALYLEHLGIKENPKGKGWAASQEYGYKVLSIVTALKNESITVSNLDSFEVTGNLKVDSNITMVANGTPNSEVVYRFKVRDPQGNWTTPQDYSTKNTFDFVPKQSGNYRFVVHVKHKNSTEEYDEYAYVDKVIADSSKVTDFNAEVSGNKINLKADATHGTDTLFKFKVRLPNGEWIVPQDYSTNKSYVFTATETGLYRVVVHVKHKTSKDEYDDYRYIDLQVGKAETIVKSFDVIGENYVGNEITMKASSVSEAGALYRFKVRDPQGKWTTIQEYSNNNTIKYTPKDAGQYRYVVNVKNVNSVNDYDSFKYVDLVVSSKTSQVKSFNVAGDKVEGQTLTMSATATPDNDSLYRFKVRDTSGNWTTVQEYSTNKSFKYVPSKAGNYRFVVNVKNKYSSADYDTFLYEDIQIGSKPNENFNVKINSFSYSGELVYNNNIRFTASAEPSNQVLYKYKLRDTNGNWSVIQDYSTKSTLDFVPSKAGDYRVVVHVKHVNSKNEYDAFEYKDISVKGNTAVVNSFNLSGDLTVGSNIKLMSTANTADAEYKYKYRDDSTGKWYVLQEYSSNSTKTINVTKPGTYRFVVHVRHKSSTAEYDDYKYIDVKIKDAFSTIKSFVMDGYTFTNYNMKFTAQAEVSNETLYRFKLKDESTGQWKVVQDYSDNNVFNFNTVKEGKYRVVVHAKNKYSKNDYDTFEYKDIVVKSSVPKVESFKVTGELKPNKTITLSAYSEVPDTLYKFKVRIPNGEWLTVSDFSSTRQINYIPKEEGNYRFVVQVKHKDSKNEYDNFAYEDYIVRQAKLIVVDPGHNHGGDDGAYATHGSTVYCERDINMEVSIKVKAELEKKGFQVVLTRTPLDRFTDDLYTSLSKRTNLANSLKADMFISIHQNSATSSARGIEIYYSDRPVDTKGYLNKEGRAFSLPTRTFENYSYDLEYRINKSIEVGQHMVNSIASNMGLVNRGLKNDWFYVNRNTEMPSLLIECGFISNSEEAKDLVNPQRQQKMAELIAQSIYQNL